MEYTLARNAAEDLTKGLGRRGFMRAVAALGAGVGVAGVASGCAHSNASPAGSSSSALPFADGIPILQPGSGNVSGDHYLSSDPSDVMWGYVPNIHTREVMRMKSGQTVTIDALSHEGILEDQGRNPLEYFGSKGVSEKDVLEDAIAVAAEYNRTERNFDKDGPHVVTGPVFAEGALFYVGDPHMAMGDGEAALTAMEGSLRGTFRLRVCKKNSGEAPSVAFGYPFAETEEAWIPIGLSDPNGSVDGQNSDLNGAMRRAVVNALDFLEHDRGMDRATAYAYLSAAADFTVSQVVDRTVGVHGQIFKSHFE
ncbi:acetamidase/formamidase family protein [Rhodococcus qingshengii]|uniref:acetamidase/formamidase family protein n=1 Tax=Rhodococcus qingshengii TaxID=334542 RepID=UPI0022B597E1|nr:acetamidase/formamidase family protein [Rhodococcus qingshengii]MCZ4617419.1 acetamidase/formamidase family protein [Rhodococcus qingshengii]